jgi:serine/threonine-protein kinase
VKGESREEAEAAMKGAGLTLTDPVFERSNETPGTVLKQSLKANKEVTLGQQVTLTLARAPKETPMPRVLDFSEENARKELVAVGLGDDVKTTTEYHPSVPAGRIIRTNPDPGVKVLEGATVTLVVSNGPEPLPETTPPAPTTSAPPEGGAPPA